MSSNKEEDIEMASVGRTASQDAPASSGPDVKAEAGMQPRRLVAPEIIRAMTPEKRAALEKALKRKIDLRLMPTIIVMYILNYIDRYAQSTPLMQKPSPSPGRGELRY
jgi:hypothetical protein